MKTFRTFVGLVVMVVVPGTSLLAQQRPLDHEDVLHWKQIDDPTLSPGGEWIAYVLTAMEGDPVLTLRPSGDEGPVFTTRGTEPVFTDDSRFLIYRVPPPEAVTDSLKREGKKGDDLPQDELAVADVTRLFTPGGLDEAGVTDLGSLTDMKVPETGSWLAYRVPDRDEEGPSEDGSESSRPSGEEQEGEETKETGLRLVVRDLGSGIETTYEFVTEYEFSEDGTVLAFVTSTEDGTGDGAYRVALDGAITTALIEGPGHYKTPALSEDGSQIAFLSDVADYEADQPEFSLYRAAGGSPATAVASSSTAGVPDGWWVSEHGSVRFSEDGTRIHLGTAPRPEPEVEDDTLEEDRVAVDVWNWKDPYLQPMQLVQLEDERKRSYGAVHHVSGGRLVQLATPDVPTLRFTDEGVHRYALGVTDVPYRQLLSWDGRYNDLYAVDMETGERRLVAEKVKGFFGGAISPGGGYASWWDGSERHWKAAPLSGGSVLTMSGDVPHPVWNELDDHPDLPPSYGAAGWTEGDEAFLFYDKYDVWRFEPGSRSTVNLTGWRRA